MRPTCLALVIAAGLLEVGALHAGGPVKPRVDRFGDPLPAGALFRIGTSRLQLRGMISVAAASMDGKLVAACDDETLAVWEVAGGRELLRRPRHGLTFLTFAPDGKSLMFGENHTLCSFEIASGKVRQTDITVGDGVVAADSTTVIVVNFHDGTGTFAIRRHALDPKTASKGVIHFQADRVTPADLLHLARFSGNGRFLATLEAGQDRKDWIVRVHDTATGGLVRRWAAKPGTRGLAISFDGKAVATICDDGKGIEVGAWELAGKTETRWTISGGLHTGVFGISFTPDGASLLVSDAAGLTRWDWRTAKRLGEFPQVGGPIAFSDAQTLVAQGPQGAIRLLDMEHGKDKLPLPHAGRDVAVSADSRLIAWSEEDAVVIGDAATGREIRRWHAHNRFVEPLAFSPDGKTLASAGTDGRVRLWNVADGKLVRPLIKTGVRALFFTPDGRGLVASLNGEVCLWDATTGERKGVWKATANTKVAWKDSPNPVMAADCQTVAVPDSKGHVVRLVNPATGAVQHSLPGFSLFVQAPRGDPAGTEAWEVDVTFSRNGRRLLAGSKMDDSQATVWDVDTGKATPLKLPQAEYLLINPALSADGGLLAVLREDGTPCVASSTAGKVQRTLGSAKNLGQAPIRYYYPFRSRIAAPTFSLDNRVLVSAIDDKLTFWELATGGEIAQRRAHNDAIRELTLSYDGRLLVSTSRDHTALVWNMTRLVTDAAAPAGNPAALWDDLASPSAVSGRRAVELLAMSSDAAISLLRDRLKPMPTLDQKKVAAWIADLGSDDLDIRDRAEQELERVVETAAPTLRKTLADGRPALEVRRRIENLLKKHDTDQPLTGDQLRTVRAVQVLEMIGTAEARAVLQTLARGAAGARLTEEAAATLRRLAEPQTRHNP